MEILNAVVVWLTVGCSAVFTSTSGEVSYGLTAAHCGVKEGDVVNARFEGRTFGCRVVSVDPVRDLALLKCFSKEIPPVSLPLAPARPGDVLLVGFPAGKLTALPGRMTELSMPMGRSFKQVVTTDQVIEPGFSGGAVLSDDGLVGIVTHSATTPAGSGAGCSLTDRLITSSAKRAEAEVETTLTPRFRDLVVGCLTLLLGRWFPGLFNAVSRSEVTERKPTFQRKAK